MNRPRAWLGFLLAWLACLVALAPMRWLGELDLWRNAGLSAAGASGTIWNGRLLGLRAGAHDLGDVDADVSALAALGGTVAITLLARDGRGELLLGRERGLRNASGEWPLALQTGHGPLRVSLALDDVSAVFRGGHCVEAGGELDAEISVSTAGNPVPHLALSGAPTCREGVVEARLLPAPGSPAIELLVQARGDGRYRLTWVARAPDPALQAALAFAGFAAAPEGLSRIDEGRLAGPGALQP